MILFRDAQGFKGYTRPLRHAVEGSVVGILLEFLGAKALPPLEQHRVAHELEPGGELVVGVLEQVLELFGGNVFRVADFIRAHVEVNVGLDEKDVVN